MYNDQIRARSEVIRNPDEEELPEKSINEEAKYTRSKYVILIFFEIYYMWWYLIL